jgi:hypothetical protein
MNHNEAILIAGGYGVVGQQIAELLGQRYPQMPLILGGRNPAKAEALVQKLTNAEAVRLDLEQPTPLNGLKPRAIIAVVNDPHDYLLLEAVQNGIPYLDITRWTERLKTASTRLSTERLRAPVVFSSAWMAGVAALTAISLARQLKTVESINISVLYSLKDKSGPNSTEYMDRLSTPYPVMLNGEQKQVYPYTDPLKVAFPGGYQTKAYRFDTPEQFTLPQITGAKTVTARIALDDAFSTNLLVFLTRSGIWRLLSGEKFTAFRRSLLYNPGKGASHEIVVEVSGMTEKNTPQHLRAEIADPQGQTHLTAVGALIQLERLLGLDGLPAPDPGILYPDTAPALESAFRMLESLGISIKTV